MCEMVIVTEICLNGKVCHILLIENHATCSGHTSGVESLEALSVELVRISEKLCKRININMISFHREVSLHIVSVLV